MKAKIFVAAACLAIAGGAFAVEEDVAGSRDHQLFSRMPGFYIGEFSAKDFDMIQFRSVPGEPRVEGRRTTIRYWQKSGNSAPGALAICRNYTNAAKQIGGVVLYDNGRNGAVMKIAKDGREAWAEVTCDDNRYSLVIVEKEAMAQVVSASDMLAAIDKQGFIALDIHFDTDRATIKPESVPIIDQIVALLKSNSALKLAVEGHTDDVGARDHNKALSQARAKSVAAALVERGIEASRLGTAGYGQDRPVADNRTEEGRAKNRRVELVKK